jgi:hypothetical protein
VCSAPAGEAWDVWGVEGSGRPLVNLARHRERFDSTAVVVPCHKEETNIGPLVDALEAAYGHYCREIILVDDKQRGSNDRVAADLARDATPAWRW